MSVSFANAVTEGLRRHGIRVNYRPGWEVRGNGQSSAYQGMIVHHTAGAFDGGMDLLVNGRSDLRGPLCNMAGHANGDVTLVAAHPANHAGASGGRSMGPLPKTSSFNRLVWGLEIMYPGTVPMTAAQMRTAQIMSGVVCGILGRPNPEWARAHAETSITGKWDPGYANGRTYNMADFRRGIWAALNGAQPPLEDQMNAAQDAMLRTIHKEVTQRLTRRISGSTYNDTVLGYAINADAFGLRANEALARIEASLKNLAGAIPRQGEGQSGDTSVRAMAAWNDATHGQQTKAIDALRAEVAALRALVQDRAA